MTIVIIALIVCVFGIIVKLTEMDMNAANNGMPLVKPSELCRRIPNYAVKAVNECIKTNYSEVSGVSVFTVGELADAVHRITRKPPTKLETWIDLIVPAYTCAGWKVKCDKPAYYEDYEQTFTFSIN